MCFMSARPSTPRASVAATRVARAMLGEEGKEILMKAKKLLGAAFVACVVAACHASMSAGVSTTTSTTSAVVDQGAIEQVTLEATKARCARLYSCGDIGPNGRYADNKACISNVRRDVRDYLIGRQCKLGFDVAAANDCVAAIRSSRCEDLRAVRDLRACNGVQMCR